MQSILNFLHDSESILNISSPTLRGVCCMTTAHDARDMNQYMRVFAFLDEPSDVQNYPDGKVVIYLRNICLLKATTKQSESSISEIGAPH